MGGGVILSGGCPPKAWTYLGVVYDVQATAQEKGTKDSIVVQAGYGGERT